MRKLIYVFLLVLITTQSFALSQIQTRVFVSFSMPDTLLEQTLSEAQKLNVTAVLNGLVDDDFRKTFSKIFELSKKYPSLSFQIDPPSFEKFHIHSVPALVVEDGKKYDVLYGNLSLEDGFKVINQNGDLRGWLS